ncbi:MAG: PatB family C-S lyase [Campylobacterota bacterium]|nr:PatB family C-S lyase [Campylobacterota bacterium]
MGERIVTFSAADRRNTHAVKWEERCTKFGTEDLIPLWVADMDLASPPSVQEAIVNRAKHPIYGYTIYPDAYFDVIISWIQRRFDWQIDREWIVPAYGVVPSINFSIEALTEAGDGVIVQTPIYPPFISSVHKHRRKFLENRLLYADGEYSIDFEDFESKAKEAKLFLFCSPHNPTGRVWDHKELERLIAICRRYDVKIVSDEIHADIVYEKKHHILASLAPERTIILNAPSKTFNIAGLNSSFAVIPDKRLRSAYHSEQRKAGLGDGNPFGIEALIAAYSSADRWLDDLKKYLNNNINFVAEFITHHKLAIIPVKTEATFLVWLDCQGLGFDDKELQEFFIKEAKLGLNSGSSFGEAGSGFMRLNIGTSREVLEEAMSRLLEACHKNGQIQKEGQR